MDLILSKLTGAFTEAEHHKIVAKLQAQEDASITLGNPEIYHHSVGLIMGKELWISAEPANITDLKQKVVSANKVK